MRHPAADPQDRASPPARGRSAGLSLKARALRYLSMREHSRLELQRKLSPHAESAEQLERLLCDLEGAQLLSDVRFVESLVQRRAGRHGLLRLQHELGQHRLAQPLVSDALEQLRASELQRALEVWRKRFGQPPADAHERARQQRFLAQRGFQSATIAQVLREAADAADGAQR